MEGYDYDDYRRTEPLETSNSNNWDGSGSGSGSGSNDGPPEATETGVGLQTSIQIISLDTDSAPITAFSVTTRVTRVTLGQEDTGTLTPGPIIEGFEACEASGSLSQDTIVLEDICSGSENDAILMADPDATEEYNKILETLEEYKCPICMEILVKTSLISCGHRFCLYCIKQWFHHSFPRRFCPVCRKNCVYYQDDTDTDLSIDDLFGRLPLPEQEERNVVLLDREYLASLPLPRTPHANPHQHPNTVFTGFVQELSQSWANQYPTSESVSSPFEFESMAPPVETETFESYYPPFQPFTAYENSFAYAGHPLPTTSPHHSSQSIADAHSNDLQSPIFDASSSSYMSTQPVALTMNLDLHLEPSESQSESPADLNYNRDGYYSAHHQQSQQSQFQPGQSLVTPRNVNGTTHFSVFPSHRPFQQQHNSTTERSRHHHVTSEYDQGQSNSNINFSHNNNGGYHRDRARGHGQNNVYLVSNNSHNSSPSNSLNQNYPCGVTNLWGQCQCESHPQRPSQTFRQYRHNSSLGYAQDHTYPEYLGSTGTETASGNSSRLGSAGQSSNSNLNYPPLSNWVERSDPGAVTYSTAANNEQCQWQQLNLDLEFSGNGCEEQNSNYPPTGTSTAEFPFLNSNRTKPAKYTLSPTTTTHNQNHEDYQQDVLIQQEFQRLDQMLLRDDEDQFSFLTGSSGVNDLDLSGEVEVDAVSVESVLSSEQQYDHENECSSRWDSLPQTHVKKFRSSQGHGQGQTSNQNQHQQTECIDHTSCSSRPHPASGTSSRAIHVPQQSSAAQSDVRGGSDPRSCSKFSYNSDFNSNAIQKPARGEPFHKRQGFMQYPPTLRPLIPHTSGGANEHGAGSSKRTEFQRPRTANAHAPVPTTIIPRIRMDLQQKPQQQHHVKRPQSANFSGQDQGQGQGQGHQGHTLAQRPSNLRRTPLTVHSGATPLLPEAAPPSSERDPGNSNSNLMGISQGDGVWGATPEMNAKMYLPHGVLHFKMEYVPQQQSQSSHAPSPHPTKFTHPIIHMLPLSEDGSTRLNLTFDLLYHHIPDSLASPRP